MDNCLFCEIINKNINSKIIYEDDEILIFNDINPKADIHVLVIPKTHITSMLELNTSHKQLLGELMLKANQIAIELGLFKGYKVQINTGKNGGQEVMHLHLHVIGNK